MVLPVQMIIGFILGIVVYWFIENKDKLIFSKGFKQSRQINPQQPTQLLPLGNKVKCSQCGFMIPKENYLDHLNSVHGIDVKKWYEELTGGIAG